MSDPFYRAFEERHYAPRQEIRRMRQQYLPFLEPLKSLYPGGAIFDLGCGRGEWLELMQEAGFNAFGVDLDDGMLEACRVLHLPVIRGDAVAHLTTLPDDSHAVISAFHVVEHISFEQLRQVVAHALRVLKPGGLLIMETPNTENIVVGTRNFYLDPTHQRPIPSQLLSFLPEYEGFARTKVLRLQESPALLYQQTVSLREVFAGVSPDYAVIAQKDTLSSTMKLFDGSFSREYGVSLDALADYYDVNVVGGVKRLEGRQREFEARAGTELSQLSKSHKELHAMVQKYVHQNLHEVALEVQKLHQAFHALQSERTQQSLAESETLHARVQQAEHRAVIAEQALHSATTALQAVQNSTSWKLLGPLRWCAIQLRLLITLGPRARVKALMGKLRHGNHPPIVTEVGVSRPSSSHASSPLPPASGLGEACDTPGESLVAQPLPGDEATQPEIPAVAGTTSQTDQVPITPRTQQVYEDLRAEMKRRGKEPRNG